MPKDKAASRARIISAARQEYMEKGFEKASMRVIAAQTGMTSAGLYRHFDDKEEMFASLVRPALDALYERMDQHIQQAWDCLECGNFEELWNASAGLTLLAGVIYEHFDAFYLLLRSAAGTRFEYFFDGFIEMDQIEMLKYMDALRTRGIGVHKISAEELHLLLNAYYSAVFEVAAHNFPKEEAMHYLNTIKRFFILDGGPYWGFRLLF